MSTTAAIGRVQWIIQICQRVDREIGRRTGDDARTAYGLMAHHARDAR